jgi:hypothetical protein
VIDTNSSRTPNCFLSTNSGTEALRRAIAPAPLRLTWRRGGHRPSSARGAALVTPKHSRGRPKRAPGVGVRQYVASQTAVRVPPPPPRNSRHPHEISHTSSPHTTAFFYLLSPISVGRVLRRGVQNRWVLGYRAFPHDPTPGAPENCSGPVWPAGVPLGPLDMSCDTCFGGFRRIARPIDASLGHMPPPKKALSRAGRAKADARNS